MADAVPVVFCFDETYANYAAVAIFSLLVHSKSAVKIYSIVPGSALDRLDAVRRVAARFGTGVHEIVVDSDAFEDWKVAGHIRSATYYRLLIPDLVDENKVIYLDSDLIVRDDLSELHATALAGGSAIGGVVDMLNGSDTKIPRIKDDFYINSGVLVMDLDRLRRDGFLQKCREIHNKYASMIVWFDQCIINKVAEGRKTIVDRKWNRLVLPQKTRRNEWKALLEGEESKIIHFVNTTKPWSSWCNPPIAEFWWGYARLLDMPDLRPANATSVAQLLSLAAILDLDQEFRESGKVKNRIIRILMDKIGA